MVTKASPRRKSIVPAPAAPPEALQPPSTLPGSPSQSESSPIEQPAGQQPIPCYAGRDIDDVAGCVASGVAAAELVGHARVTRCVFTFLLGKHRRRLPASRRFHQGRQHRCRSSRQRGLSKPRSLLKSHHHLAGWSVAVAPLVNANCPRLLLAGMPPPSAVFSSANSTKMM